MFDKQESDIHPVSKVQGMAWVVLRTSVPEQQGDRGSAGMAWGGEIFADY
jgi:hypothetical protein